MPYVDHMFDGTRRPLLLCPVVFVVTLVTIVVTCVGCVEDQLPEVPTDTSSDVSAPFFDTDELALNAVVDGYAEYLSVSDAITGSGGVDPQRINPYVSPDLLPNFLAGFDSLAKKGLRTQGDTTQDSTTLQSWSKRGAKNAVVTMYVCVDLTKIRVLDSVGNDATPMSRMERVPLIVTMDISRVDESAVLTRNDPWSGDTFC